MYVCIIFHSKYFFFFNDTATTEIYTLSLHDALPILIPRVGRWLGCGAVPCPMHCEMFSRMSGLSPLDARHTLFPRDRKSTRLNSSHANISYAVFCLKKKKKQQEYELILQTV